MITGCIHVHSSKFQFQVPHSHRCCDACRRSSAPHPWCPRHTLSITHTRPPRRRRPVDDVAPTWVSLTHYTAYTQCPRKGTHFIFTHNLSKLQLFLSILAYNMTGHSLINYMYNLQNQFCLFFPHFTLYLYLGNWPVDPAYDVKSLWCVENLTFSRDDGILIKNVRLLKDYNATNLIEEFLDKGF